MGDRRPRCNVLPVGLITDGRRFLVVGGGKVALRKVRLLLDARARVRVVSPEACDEMRELAERGEVEYVQRVFQDGDVEGVDVAFAATNDRGVNLHVLECCRRRGVLCSAVDKSWPESDFVTPATFRRDGLMVSVSTSGTACRRARTVKEHLARHVEAMGECDIAVIGTSHEQVPIEVRESLHLAGDAFDLTGRMLDMVWGVHEFVLLNTCNRIELAAVLGRAEEALPLVRRILGFDRLGDGEFYVRRGFDAFGHMALVVSGLRSQSAGEDHIVAQVKDALAACERAGWARGAMRGWFGAMHDLSKDIRAAVASVLAGGEIEDTAVRLLEDRGITPAAGRAVVIAGGAVGRGAVERLVARGFACDWLYHRNRPQLRREWRDRVNVAEMDELAGCLARAAAVVCAAAGAGPVVTEELAPHFRTDRATVVLDLGIPRNVAPALAQRAPQVEIVDLDDLKDCQAGPGPDAAGALALAERIVDDHKDMYVQLIESLQGRDPSQ